MWLVTLAETLAWWMDWLSLWKPYRVVNTLHAALTSYAWPWVQSSLPSRYWTLWNQALRKCFMVLGSALRRLRDKLGSWQFFSSRW
jgi:hypothetical protein